MNLSSVFLVFDEPLLDLMTPVSKLRPFVQ